MERSSPHTWSPNMSDQDALEIAARLDERVKALNARFDKIEPKIDFLISFVERQRGGWWTLTVICGLAGSLGAVVTKMLSTYPSLPIK